MTILNPSARTPLLADLGLLIVRLAVGAILIAHGWQKYDDWTISGTADSFGGMGIPAPDLAAATVTGAELIGGAAVVLGLLTPIAAAINAVVMLVALFTVHLEAGIFASEGGYELVLALFALLAVLTLKGAGRFSADRLFSRRVTG